MKKITIKLTDEEYYQYVKKGRLEYHIRMKTAEEHAMRDHGYIPEDLMTPELREKIRSHIKRS